MKAELAPVIRLDEIKHDLPEVNEVISLVPDDVAEEPRFEQLDIDSVLMVCSTGGHLLQLLRLKPWWQRMKRTWVTFDKQDGRSFLKDEQVVWAHHPTTRNLFNAARNLLLAFRLLRRQRPELVISNGAGVAFPFFIAARLMGIKTAYVEVCDRIDSASLTGRMCYPLSDLFFIQCEEQRAFYPRAIMIGRLL